MAHLVEGNWKHFIFQMIGKADFPAVSEHLRNNFYIDEPISKIVGNSEAKFKDFDTFVAGILDLNDNLSFVAIDNDTRKIAAVRITFRNRKGFNISQAFKFESVEREIIINFVGATNKAGDVFEKYGIEEYADLFVASVDANYRRQGLATEMYRRTLLLLKALDFVAVKSIFSSPHTRRIAVKHGFEEITRRHFREIQNLNGDYLCPNAGDEDFAAVMSLKL